MVGHDVVVVVVVVSLLLLLSRCSNAAKSACAVG